MEEVTLCSGLLKEFIEKTDVNIPDFDAMASHIAVHLISIADALNIGRLDVQVTVPPNTRNRKPKTIGKPIYTSEIGFEDAPLMFDQKTGEGGKSSLYVYPLPGHSFTPIERSDINTVGRVIHMALGRSRMMNLLDNVPFTDGLTGISNTAGFMRFGNILAAKNTLRNYSVVFVNIKNFKYINRSIGARGGDRLLVEFAQSCKATLDHDEKIGRMGGDNFTILVKKEHEKAFLEFIKQMSLSIELGNGMRNFDIEVRAGICRADDVVNMDELVMKANTALNIARTVSRENIVFFNKDMLSNSMHDKFVSSHFKRALKEHEFVVYYQPKVDLMTNTLCGCEALVRWIHNGKMIPPMDFIPVLEHEGTVCELDFYVFEQMLKDLRAWIDSGLSPVRISSNFSKVNLTSPTLSEDILRLKEAYDINSDLIEVELTEMSGHDDMAALVKLVSDLKKAGVRTSIDDFGTGYSSINLLKELPVDVIKLDKSFLNDAEQRTASEEIVIKNTVNMICELGMTPLAEGVETEGQASFLRGVRCQVAQGYLYDRPLPHDEFEQRLRNKKYTFNH